MKKLFVLILSASMLLSLAACGKEDKTESTEASSVKETVSETEAVNNTDATQNNAGADAVILLPGELYQFDKDYYGGPAIKGLTLKGNRIGSSEFNEKDPDVKGIRCIFELNEWVEFYPDMNGNDVLWVYVFKHVDNVRDYTEMAFTEEDTRVLATCTLEDPGEEGYQWGALYLNPDYAGPGVYDIVFVKDGQAVAIMKAQFFDEGALSDKTDDDLSAMMKDF